MKKIIIIVLFVAILFIVSLISQSKYSYLVIKEKQQVESLFYQKIKVLNESFIFMDVLTTLIVISFGIMIIILIFILFNRRKMERQEKMREKLLVDYQKIILSYLENEKNIINPNIINTHFKKQLMIDQIIDIGLNLPKEKLIILKNLYYELNLIEDTENKIKSGKWHLTIKGIKELSFLGITEYNNEIKKHINSNNENLRIESQIALIRLASKNDKNPFDFLSELKYPLSLWEQITLHELMIRHDIKPPDFGRWIFCENPSVIKFSLRMIREYKQISNQDKIEKILYYNDIDVRKLAIIVIGDLKIKKLIKSLKNRYKHETYENSVEIIKAFGKFSDENTIGFLQKVIDAEDDVQLQIEATKAIKNMGDLGNKALTKMLNSDYKNYKIIIKHVLDNRIN